jgi:hypothetical protein
MVEQKITKIGAHCGKEALFATVWHAILIDSLYLYVHRMRGPQVFHSLGRSLDHPGRR